jgi:hypothetical protein
MSFGLRNAAQTFQRFMDNILRGLEFCFAYIDDILIFSHTHSSFDLRPINQNILVRLIPS